MYVHTAFQFAVCSAKIAMYCNLHSGYFTYKASWQKAKPHDPSCDNSFVKFCVPLESYQFIYVDQIWMYVK